MKRECPGEEVGLELPNGDRLVGGNAPTRDRELDEGTHLLS